MSLKSFFSRKKSLTKTLKEKNAQIEQSINLGAANQESRFFKGLKNIRFHFASLLSKDDTDYKQIQTEIEESLIKFDFGAQISAVLAEKIVSDLKYSSDKSIDAVKKIVKNNLLGFYGSDSDDEIKLKDKCNIWLICGVNGVGKTSTIAKIAHRFIQDGKKILFIAGDTFRAGAIEQLNYLAQRLKVDIIMPERDKEDPAALIYKGLEKCQQYDLVLCDTSGRLHNKEHLMNEMQKIYKIIKKFDAQAPDQSLLVLDSIQGQLALKQAEAFLTAAQISGIILTKTDNAARGGLVFVIKNKHNIPIKYITFGEELSDLKSFRVEEFVDKFINQIEFV